MRSARKSGIGTCGDPSFSVSCLQRKSDFLSHTLQSLFFLTHPFILFLFYSVLSIATNADDKTLLFEIVFCIVWIGGAVIAVNGQLLGGNISFFQSICLLGYCLFPLNMAAVINLFIGSFVHIIVKLIYVAVAFVWSTYCKCSQNQQGYHPCSIQRGNPITLAFHPSFPKLRLVFLTLFFVFLHSSIRALHQGNGTRR